MNKSTENPTVPVEESIKIKIMGSSSIFKEVKYKVNKYKSLAKVFKQYTKFIGCDFDSVQFTFNGKRVKGNNPNSLNMKNGDVIQVEKTACHRIKIFGAFDMFKEKYYSVDSSKSLFRLTKKYSKSKGIDHNSVKFTFNGKVIENGDTPESLKMKNVSEIQVETPTYINTKADGSLNNSTPSSPIIENGDATQVSPIQTKINVKIVDSLKMKEVDYSIGYNKSLSTITNQYTDQIGEDRDCVKFTFNGKTVNFRDTPKNLKMENGDVLHFEKIPPISLNFVSNFHNEVSLSIPGKTSIYNMVHQYESHVEEAITQIYMVYKDRILHYDETLMKLNMKDDDVIYVYTEKDQIDIKLIGTDSNKVPLCVSLVAFMQKIRLQYESCVGSSQETILIYNDNFISDYDTPLSLNMKNKDAIQVYTKDDKINFKISLQSKIPKDSNYSLKYGDSLDPVMIGFTDKMGVDLNSVRFMIGDRRIKSGKSLKEAKIPPNAVILVFEEYETFSLKLLAYKNSSTIFPIEAQYGDSFSNILKQCGRFVDDHSNIGLARWGVPGDIILGHQNPKELEMSNNDIVMFYRKPEINLKVAENLISKEQKEGTPNKYINLKVSFENFTEMNFRTKIDLTLKQLKKDIADKIGKSVSCLRFLFDGTRILDDHTPQSLEMEENDVIEVNIIYITII